MSELVKASETFACQWGLYHEGDELPAGHPAVKAFPQFFEPVGVPAPVKRGPTRRTGAVT